MAPSLRNRNASKPTGFLPKSKNVMVELSLKHGKACMLCGHKEISEKLYGPLYFLDNYVVHYYCLLLSSNIFQKGADNEGIWGFLLKDIKAELTRGSKIICFYCNKKGATISCCGKKCQKVFHLPCGMKNGSMQQFFRNFKSFCLEHRIPQIIDSSQLIKSTSTQCAICKDAVIPSPIPASIWAPCCKRDSWFHRECVQDLALSAGYFFKCPLCNNVGDFKRTMLTLGIYIPSRDASWERVPNAFAELSERHSICNIETCQCPHKEKRKFQCESGSWEILLCELCGLNGTHRMCSSVKGEQDWCCAVCKNVTNKVVIKKENKIQLELLDNGNCSGSLGMFEEQDLSGNREISQRQNSVIVANGGRPQSLDDPIVILDSGDRNHSSAQCISDNEPSNTYAIELPNTHSQVQQIPQIQLPIISSYGSLTSRSYRNFLGIHHFANPMSIDLTSEDDDD